MRALLNEIRMTSRCMLFVQPIARLGFGSYVVATVSRLVAFQLEEGHCEGFILVL